MYSRMKSNIPAAGSKAHFLLTGTGNFNFRTKYGHQLNGYVKVWLEKAKALWKEGL